MNPESTAHALRKLSISVHEMRGGKLEALIGKEGMGMTCTGDEGIVRCDVVAQAVAERESIRKLSPLPLPEHIIQIIIDIIRDVKDEALAAHASENALYTHKAVEHAHRYDGGLKNLSLVSRLWTQPARHALGRRLVLIMDAKRLPAISRAVESPLYGAWTQHVEILEMPYAPARGEVYVNEIWSLAQRVISRLENVKTFTFNSRILNSSASHLLRVLSSSKSLEELALLNTGPLTRPGIDNGKLSLPFQLRSLRKMTFQRCLPVLQDSVRQSGLLGMRDALNISSQLQSMKQLLFTPLECCFLGNHISFEYDEENACWSIDRLRVSNSASHCGEGCDYEDASNVCARARSLSVVGSSKNSNPACLLKMLRNFTHLKVLFLSLPDFPRPDIFDAISNDVEIVCVGTESVLSSEDGATRDGLLLSFCEARAKTLRQVYVFSHDGTSRLELFPSTKSFCSSHKIEFNAYMNT